MSNSMTRLLPPPFHLLAAMADAGGASDVAPTKASEYKNPHYWDKRFLSEEHYEWFKDYTHFRSLFHKHVLPASSVLEIGCGNSRLSEELYKDGVTDITCMDISTVAVEKLQGRLLGLGYKDIKVLVADMLDLPFEDESFDVVIEKGTMDVLFVDSGDPWKPKPETVSNVMKMLDGVHRVLKSNGTFISIAFGQPHFRRPLFESPQFSWSFEWSTFGDGFHYFFYALKKGTRIVTDAQCNGGTEKLSLCLFQEELEGEDFLFRIDVDELQT